MSGPRYVCIHGHFYQPPRENPWLEAVEVQDSAAPYHDWNERITRECYAPNSRARLLDGDHRIAGLCNNYAWMSFNFGPTLLDWLEEGAPDVLHGIVEGDRLSRGRRRGHGNALAQVYNHIILPLASGHDRRTQVRWGVADFVRRFGREPEGMWLAETAVDLESLEALAAEGIRFTILSQRQAKRWRPAESDAWVEIPDGIDPSRAYRCQLPSGREMALFFYDDAISRAVAFGGLLASGEKFVSRLKEGFDDARTHAQLVHIATDGESYGHHHAHGDMALAYALQAFAADPSIRLTNYGEFLALHPPEWDVEIHENSSWSCAHGVERWRSDCGCNARSDWQQRWRAPLRAGLDALKNRLDTVFESHGARQFRDVWAARDAYVDVVLRRGDEVHPARPAGSGAAARAAARGAVDAFLRVHGREGAARSDSLYLLEMQRNALLMFTSCGWFFDDVSGIETVQCLQYAARALQLAGRFESVTAEERELVRTLAQAPGNVPQYPDGGVVWEQLVRPARVDLERVLAHHAVTSLFHELAPVERLYCYEVECLDLEVRRQPRYSIAVGRLHARSVLTLDEAETAFVVLHSFGLNFRTVLRPDSDAAAYAAFKRALFATVDSGSQGDVAGLIESEFPGPGFRLEDLFADERRRLVGLVLKDRLEEYHATFALLASADAATLSQLGRMRGPIPMPMRAAASVVLDHQLSQGIRGLDGEATFPALKTAVERGKTWGYRPDRERLQQELSGELRKVLQELRAGTNPGDLVARASRLLDVATLVGVKLDLWHTQNQLLETYARIAEDGGLTPALHESLARLADRLNIAEGLLGWKP